MDKRLILAIGVSMAILAGWWLIFPPQQPAPAPLCANNLPKMRGI